MADGTIQITVGLDSRKFSRDLRQLRREVDGMRMDGIGRGATDASNGVDRLKNSSNKALSVLSSLKNTLIKAFAVGAVIKFGKECLELGSNLAEVQNVVDTAFPTMSSQLDEFAKGAMNSFGLSETMAKQYASTFGAMGQAFGFTEKEAYSMSTALTGLSGDVASFYNISQDMAYTKLKSVFTGETESLKELGIVMTQSALDQYAMANGFGKTTQAMSEQEKVALRFRFVTEQLSMASGDFAKTSTSWANQTRIASLQMQSIKASIGQGLIAVLTPAINLINKALGYVNRLASAFAGLMQMLTGTKIDVGGLGQANSDMAGLADASEGATDGTKDLTNATKKQTKAQKKANKELNNNLSGLDQIRTYKSDNKDSSDAGGAGSGAGAGLAGALGGFGADIAKQAKDGEDGVSALTEKVKELRKQFLKGFNLTFDKSKFASIKTNLGSIRQSLKDIFPNVDVKKSASEFASTLAFNFGKIAGNIANVGLSIADWLTGGISQYLEKNKGRISKFITNTFDLGSSIADTIGDLSDVLSEVFKSLESSGAKKILEDIIQIISDGFGGAVELFMSVGDSLLKFFVNPLKKNATGIRGVLESLFDFIGGILDGVASTFRTIVDGILGLWDTHLAPLVETISNTISDVLGILIQGYNQYIKPVLDNLKKKFLEVIANKLNPALESLFDAVGSVIDVIKGLWKDAIEPVLKYIAKRFFPTIAPIVEFIGDVFVIAIDLLSSAFKFVSKYVKIVCEVFKSLRPVIRVVAKVFTSLCTILSKVFVFALKVVLKIVKFLIKAFAGIAKIIGKAVIVVFKTFWKIIKKVVSVIKPFAKVVKTGLVVAFKGLKKIVTPIIKLFKKLADFLGKKLSSPVKSASKLVKGKLGDAFKGIGDKVGKAVKGLKDMKKKVKDLPGKAKLKVETEGKKIVDGLSTAWQAIKTKTSKLTMKTPGKDGVVKASNAWNKVDVKKTSTLTLKKSYGTNYETARKNYNAIKGKRDATLSLHRELGSGYDDARKKYNAVNSKDATVTIGKKFGTGYSNAISDYMNLPKKQFGTVGFKAELDTTSVNTYAFKVLEKLNPAMNKVTLANGVPAFPKNPLKIPGLALGGVIPPNKEFLAILGDQKRGTNIEAPLTTIQQAVRDVFGEVDLGGSSTYTFVAQLDGKTIFQKTVNEAQMAKVKTGKNPLLV